MRRRKPQNDVEAFVLDCARKYLNVEHVVLFGSRARGDHGRRSDYDFVIGNPQKDHASWARFASEVKGGAPTLCEIDLVDHNSQLDSAFEQKIADEGIEIGL